jgi:hypothetical protein
MMDMEFEIDNKIYNVIITRKNNKNTYIRVKSDLNIYVTTSYFATKGRIMRLLEKNKEDIKKMIEHQAKQLKKEESFFYLGNKYDIIEVSNQDNVEIVNDTIYVKNKRELNKWYKEETIRIFDERFVKIYNQFEEVKKSPILKIRTMKTRWGVYNRSNHSITLNSKLIEFEEEIIDYVIIHELSHIIHFDHSAGFWTLVSKYCPNYKAIRKYMKE